MPKLKKKTYADDDGRVIADMNVAGMPWFDSKADARSRLFGPGRHKGRASRAEEKAYLQQERTAVIDKWSVRILLRSSILASLLIVGVYILAFVAVILLLTTIW